MLWPFSEESIFHQVNSTQRLMIFNDLSKEIEVANEIRNATSLKKIYNIMIVPVHAGDSKIEPALLLMINRFAGSPE
jgi:hypothetical protein